LGALLLFLTNVGAILLSALIVMALYQVSALAAAESDRPQVNRRLAVAVVMGFVVVLSVPLGISTVRTSSDAVDRAKSPPVAEQWAEAAGWQVTSVRSTNEGVEVLASGGLPAPEPQTLRRDLDAAGLGDIPVVVALVPSQRVRLPPS
jgi:hypothetical protein